MKLKGLFIFLLAVIMLLPASCKKQPSHKNSSLTSDITVSLNSGSSVSSKGSHTGSNKNSSSKSPQADKNSSRIPIYSFNKNPNTSSPSSDIVYDDYMPNPELPISKRLIDLATNTEVRELRFYNVKNTGYATKSYILRQVLSEGVTFYKDTGNKDTISYFIQDMQFDLWKEKKYNGDMPPSYIMYFDQSFHINLEEEDGKIYWMSISSSFGKSYYTVPKAVYELILSICLDV